MQLHQGTGVELNSTLEIITAFSRSN